MSISNLKYGRFNKVDINSSESKALNCYNASKTVFLVNMTEGSEAVTIDADFKASGIDTNCITVGPANSAADYEYDGTDLGATLNSIIASDTLIWIYKGSYNVTTTINFKGCSRCTIKGAGRGMTKLFFAAGTSAFDMDEGDGGTATFENQLSDLTIIHGPSPSGSATGNTGTTAIKIGRQKTNIYTNLYIRYFETGINLRNEVFYTNFHNIQLEDPGVTGIIIQNGADDRSNSNHFFGVKIRGSLSPTVACTYCVRIKQGNENAFYGCVFENWSGYGVYFDGTLSESNYIAGGRCESNNQSPTGYIYFGASSKNNYINGLYLAGNDWVSRSTSVSDNGAGNWYEFPTYQGEFIQKERALLTAGDFVTYKRSGAGSGTDALMTLYDSYSASGNSRTLLCRNERSTGYFIVGQRSSTEYFDVTTTGIVRSALGLTAGAKNQSDQDTYVKFLSSTGGSDYDARLMRASGTNGNLSLTQVGTGEIRLANGSNTYVKMGSTGRVGIRSANASAPGAKVHLSDTAAAMDLLLEREDTVTAGNVLSNIYIRNNGTNTGAIVNTRRTSTVNTNATQDFELFTRDDTTAGGALTSKLKVSWDGVTTISGSATIAPPANSTAFITYTGTSEAGTTKNISTYTTGNTIQGFFKVNINGTDRWLPYYDAPTS